MALASVVFALLAFGPVAAAQAPTSEVTRTTTLSEEELRQQACEFGRFHGFQEDCANPSEDTGGSSRSIWVTLAAVVVWLFIPLGLAVAIADSRGESVVIAVVLALLLGWFGLLLVFAFLGRRRRHEAALRTGL